ncbi:MAG: Gfo/Idh/MocA family oxidoreductase [bacterium]|nr:Gfo/Idh/MocA family oxidoreductase [bacterium]
MANRIRLGMMGGGPDSLIGIVHRIAAYMGERYKLVGGVFTADYDLSKSFAEELELDVSRTYSDIDSFIEGENKLPENERIEVITVATPNFLHYSMAKKLLQAGFNVICEKPVTFSAAEAQELSDLVERTGKTFAVTHTYTGYPMVRQLKTMVAEGVLGKIQKVDAQYYQGWINPFIHEPEKRKQVWRLDPAKSGPSCCIGDIGVHSFNLIEYTCGLKVKQVLSDIDTMYDDNPLDVDGTVLLRFENNVKGVICASQIATGEENSLKIAVYGEKGGLRWEQENPNYLYYLTEDKPLQILKPGHDYNGDFAKESVKLPPGHPEGMFDAMGNIYSGVAKALRGEDYHDGAYPNVTDGVRGMRFIEAVINSTKEGNVWKEI